MVTNEESTARWKFEVNSQKGYTERFKHTHIRLSVKNKIIVYYRRLKNTSHMAHGVAFTFLDAEVKKKEMRIGADSAKENETKIAIHAPITKYIYFVKYQNNA